MNAVGVGAVHPLMVIPILAGIALYGVYVWALLRLLARVRWSARYALYAVLLDLVLLVLRSGPRVSWMTINPLYAKIPASAFVAILVLAFVPWAAATEREPPAT